MSVIGKLKKKRKSQKFDSKISSNQVESKDGIRSEFYKNIRATNPDGTGEYSAQNEVSDSATGEYDYTDYYGKVDKDGAHVLPAVKVSPKKKKKKLLRWF